MINFTATFSALNSTSIKSSARTVADARQAIASDCDKVGGDVVVQWDNGHVERFDGVEWIESSEEV